MKKILKTIWFLPLVALTLVFTACSDDDDNTIIIPTERNVVEVALDTPELTLLVQALQLADGDLVNVLVGDGPFTVLAPTNAAFTAFLNTNGFGSLDEVPTDVLSQVLLNHVIMSNVTSSDLTAAGSGYASSSATNPAGLNLSLFFNTTNGVRFNNTASVTEADIDASNGVVHIIDAVIGLPSIVDHAVANPNFTSLVTALGAADGNLIDVLNERGCRLRYWLRIMTLLLLF